MPREAVLDDLPAGHEREPAIPTEEGATDDEQERCEQQDDEDEEIVVDNPLERSLVDPALTGVAVGCDVRHLRACDAYSSSP